MVKTYAYGFPRIGKDRGYKKVIEKFWKGEITEIDFRYLMMTLDLEITSAYREYVDFYPVHEMTIYDKMLDTAIMLGVYDPKTLDEYYELCRGKDCLEMTKWFNTNYHYLVPDLTEWEVDLNSLKNDIVPSRPWTCSPSRSKNEPYCSIQNNSSFIGPFTFLKLSKGVDDMKSYCWSIAMAYASYINKFKNISDIEIDTIHIEEPAFVMDLTEEEISCIKEIYSVLKENIPSIKINLFTYYEDVDWLDEFLQLPVDGFGLDFVNGKNNYDNLLSTGFPKDKTLFAGMVSGLNVWKTNSVGDKVDKLSEMTEIYTLQMQGHFIIYL